MSSETSAAESVEARVPLLRRLRPFQTLSPEVVADVSAAMTTVQLPAGAAVVLEGEMDNFVFILNEGQIQVSKRTDDGSEAKLYELKPGDGSGFGSFFENVPHGSSAIAITPVTVFRLDHAAFRSLLAKHPSLPMSLLSFLTQELREVRGHFASVLGMASAAATASKPTNKDEPFLVAFYDTKDHMASFFKQQLQLANNTHIELRFLEVKLGRDTAKLAQGCQAVCCFVNDHVDSETAVALNGLGIKLIAMRCAGFNNVDIKTCEALGISVCRVPAYSPYAVAEHAVALLLSLNRKICRSFERVRNGNFTLDGLVGWDIHGTTIGVIGTGKIGQCLIDIMLGFGCKILCYDKYPIEALDKRPNVQYVPLDQLLAESRAISIHVPLTPETFHLINTNALEKMKRGVVIVNTSRGALINTKDLIDALKTGQVGGAGLDVYEEEDEYFFEDLSNTNIQDDKLARLLTFNNVIITSHQAFLTEEALNKIASTTLSNIAEFQAGKRQKDLTNSVTSQQLV